MGFEVFGQSADTCPSDTCMVADALSSKAYLGIADNSVAPGKREERKSVGVERLVGIGMPDAQTIDAFSL